MSENVRVSISLHPEIAKIVEQEASKPIYRNRVGDVLHAAILEFLRERGHQFDAKISEIQTFEGA